MITEGIKYAGSKKKLINEILEIVKPLYTDNNKIKILDGFCGTTRVAQSLDRLNYNVTANDVSEWSEVFGNCYLLSTKPDSFYQPMIDEMNSLKGYDGWFTEYYGGLDEIGKKPFRKHNTQKLDAIREKIEKYNLEFVDKSVLLTSLILALDKVDNTMGHYASYLKGWSKRSFNTLELKMPCRNINHGNNRVIKGDIFDVLANDRFDICYFDPPYGTNNEKMPSSRIRYNSYYHIWKTVILNDRPQVFGKANRREDTHDKGNISVFEDKNLAKSAIEKLIKLAESEYILFSYNNSGYIEKEEMLEIISKYRKIKLLKEIPYSKNAMAYSLTTKEWINKKDQKHEEYLILCQ